MWFRPVTRREVIDLISIKRGGGPDDVEEASTGFLDSVPPDTMVGIWPAHPREFGRLPATVIVPTAAHREFLAWVATYARDFRPFTSFCRVVERRLAELLLGGPPVPVLRQAEAPCVGLILGEMLMQSQGATSTLNASDYSTTLSFALSRAFALTGSSSFWGPVVSLWEDARKLTSKSRTTVSPAAAAVAPVWNIAVDGDLDRRSSRTLFGASENVRGAWRELAIQGDMNEGTWENLTNGMPELRPTREMRHIPREQRLEVVDNGLGVLTKLASVGDERWPFVAGYITSLISPGTLDHAEVLTHVAGKMPTALLWYGLFAGIGIRGEGLSIETPIVRKIIRDLTSPDRLIDRPRCDIALEELAVIGSFDGAGAGPLTRSGLLNVDLLPGLTISLPWYSQEQSSSESESRARDQESNRILLEIEETAMRQRMLADQLRNTLKFSERNRTATNRRKRTDRS